MSFLAKQYSKAILQHTLRRRALATVASAAVETKRKRRLVFDNRSPSFQDFLSQQEPKPVDPSLTQPDQVPYLNTTANLGQGRKFFIEVYGCQMNVNDTEILNSIMTKTGFVRTDNLDEANVVFLVTCAIRDNAEVRIWDRLKYLRHYKTKINVDSPPIVGVLGCMAERLKTKLLEEDRLVDIVCGPDGYRSIPHLISLTEQEEYTDGIANVMLSADETYADVMPMRLDTTNASGWVSIMRGCNNMCSFCISRPIDSILDEVRYLNDQGVKEVTVLGQNVNSYRDESESKYFVTSTTAGSSLNGGRRFTELLDKVRFSYRLSIDASRPNICNSVHLPIQSGSNTVLERMRRGYTRKPIWTLCVKKHCSSTIQGRCRESVKARRLQEIVNTFHKHASLKNQRLIGNRQLVLIDSERPKVKYGVETKLSGRTDEGLKKGDYVEVEIKHATSASLTGRSIGLSSIQQFNMQKRGYSTQHRPNVRSMYRRFLRAGQAATEGPNKKHAQSLIHSKIRLSYTHASQRKGIEFDIVRNLCQPPLYNRRMSPSVKQLHDNARQDWNLQLCLI
ncbi:uncharacterized protein B0P05DRAFT_562406 [Gilbertella persicaria]|uniref:uncharacterized protein n=1 Tax=Gilbertella persicaria TaxID=101096 RepID=UPI002220DE99|nr:uncharacterized protein B0P05DRAFT_562406 [Gilbertella persicaria]KAI8051930.1 hypothetical protein B0P05DRAFT_562406 [Gilbertella persicaria]